MTRGGPTSLMGGLLVLFTLLLASPLGACAEEAPEEPGVQDGLYISDFRVHGNIDHHYAVTEFSQDFENPTEEAREASFRVQIPTRAFIANFSLEAGGEVYYGRVLERQDARQEYTNASVAGHTSALLEMKDTSVFTYSVTVAAGSSALLTLRYEEFLEQRSGEYRYELLLAAVTAYYHISRFSMDIDITAGTEMIGVEIPDGYSHAGAEKIGSSGYQVDYETGGRTSFPDCEFVYRCAPTGKNGIMLTSGTEEEGYFLHLFSPQRGELGEAPMDKRMIFVLDKSDSMKGDKMAQLREAFGEIIMDLSPEDTFNLVTFDKYTYRFWDEARPATRENREDARAYIEDMELLKGTNIDDAMKEGLDILDRETDQMRVLVMLTDGRATQGETNTYMIRDHVRSENTKNATVFCLGFGWNVEFDFLDAMALENGGQAHRIETDGDAAGQMTGFYDSISSPLLTNVSFRYPDTVGDAAPPQQTYLFEGAELAVLGRYIGEDGVMPASVSCNSGNGSRLYSADFTLGGEGNDFIPRLWAYRHIMSLMDEMLIYGNSPALEDEIVELALVHSFVTPYTSLFVDIPSQAQGSSEENGPDGDGDGVILGEGGYEGDDYDEGSEPWDIDDSRIAYDGFDGADVGDGGPGVSGALEAAAEKGGASGLMVLIVIAIAIPLIIGAGAAFAVGSAGKRKKNEGGPSRENE